MLSRWLSPDRRGVGAGSNSTEVVDRLRCLKAEIKDLERKERELDQHKLWVQQSIRNVVSDAVSSRYPCGAHGGAGGGGCWRLKLWDRTSRFHFATLLMTFTNTSGRFPHRPRRAPRAGPRSRCGGRRDVHGRAEPWRPVFCEAKSPSRSLKK